MINLPSGLTWNISANGSSGTLIVNVDGAGNITGTVFGQTIVGYFDSSSGALYFLRVTSPDLSTFQVYKGKAFPQVVTSSSITQTIAALTLAGEFEEYPVTGTVSHFSWFAQESQKVKEKEKEKEGKEHKDKDQKDKEKDQKDKEGHLEQVTDVPLAISQLTQRMNFLEQRVATGTAFIKPEERPAVSGSPAEEQPQPSGRETSA